MVPERCIKQLTWVRRPERCIACRVKGCLRECRHLIFAQTGRQPYQKKHPCLHLFAPAKIGRPQRHAYNLGYYHWPSKRSGRTAPLQEIAWWECTSTMGSRGTDAQQNEPHPAPTGPSRIRRLTRLRKLWPPRKVSPSQHAIHMYR